LPRISLQSTTANAVPVIAELGVDSKGKATITAVKDYLMPTVGKKTLEKKKITPESASDVFTMTSSSHKLDFRNLDAKVNLKRTMGAYRFMYNATRDFMLSPALQQAKDSQTGSNKYIIRDLLVANDSAFVQAHPWLLECTTYDIRNDAAMEFLTAWDATWDKCKKENAARAKKGEAFKPFSDYTFKHRSKKNPSESMKWKAKWLKSGSLSIPSIGIQKNVKVRGPKISHKFQFDVKIVRTNLNEFSIHVPEIHLCNPSKLQEYVTAGNTQTGSGVSSMDDIVNTLRVCALDPGVRTFQTIFDASSSQAFHIAHGDMARIYRILKHVDDLQSHIETKNTAMRSKQRCALRRVQKRGRRKVKHLVCNLHHETAKFLVSNYDVVFLPHFEVSQMVAKKQPRGSRRLHKKSVRQMLTWSHFEFKKRLVHKCLMTGTQLFLCGEAHTSKTCTHCGFCHKELGGNKTFNCPGCGCVYDRDIGGGRNIFIKNAPLAGLRVC
jgi:transposase